MGLCNMSKEKYRAYFLYWKQYIRFSMILDEISVPRSNFSQFIHGNDNSLSLEKLRLIKQKTEELFSKIGNI